MKAIKPSLLFLLSYLSIFSFIAAQECLQGNGWTVLRSQQEVDDFLNNYPGCIHLGSSLRIDGNPNSDIDNLQGLNQLKTIKGSLHIRNNPRLRSLEGLENLEFIGNSLIVETNDQLASLKGLEQLQEVEGDVDVVSNPKLRELEGLRNLHHVGRRLRIGGSELLESLKGLELLDTVNHLIISGHQRLNSLEGLHNLKVVKGSFHFSYNESLRSFAGLEQLQSIGYNVYIRGNSALESFSGLENLRSIEDYVYILYNPALISFEGLNQLTHIGSYFFIRDNYALISLDGLEQLESIGWYFKLQDNESLSSIEGLKVLSEVDYFVIGRSPLLQFCSTPALCQLIQNKRHGFLFENNAEGCNSTIEIINGCPLVSKVHATVYQDLNQNNRQDVGEPLYPDPNIQVAPDELVYFLNSSNSSILFPEPGTYQLSCRPPSADWRLTTDTTFSIQIDSSLRLDTIQFGIYPVRNYASVISSLEIPDARCGESFFLELGAKNLGTVPSSGTVWLEVDDQIPFRPQFLATPPDTIFDNRRHGWHFTNLQPGHTFKLDLLVFLPLPPTVEVGATFRYASFVEYSDGNQILQSHLIEKKEIFRCSFDPNDKAVSPDRPEYHTQIGEELLYTIRFQNTGNAIAYDVVVRDTLDPALDPSTFRLISTSHPKHLSTSLEDGKYLTFAFPYIYLPDSLAYPYESQGYISYQICPYANLPVQTVINNKAAIYFDQNPPIITNTTTNILVDELTSTQESWAPQFIFYPNPTRHMLYLRSDIALSGQISINDIHGRQLLFSTLSPVTEIDLSPLPPGVYFASVSTPKGSFNQKIIKQ